MRIGSALILGSFIGLLSACNTQFSPTSPSHYTGQVLIADTASLTSMVAGTMADSSAIATTGVFGLTLAAPTIHAVQGEWLRGTASLVTRSGVLIASAATCLAALQPRLSDELNICFLLLRTGLPFISIFAVEYLLIGHERDQPARSNEGIQSPGWSFSGTF